MSFEKVTMKASYEWNEESFYARGWGGHTFSAEGIASAKDLRQKEETDSQDI